MEIKNINYQIHPKYGLAYRDITILERFKTFKFIIPFLVRSIKEHVFIPTFINYKKLEKQTDDYKLSSFISKGYYCINIAEKDITTLKLLCNGSVLEILESKHSKDPKELTFNDTIRGYDNNNFPDLIKALSMLLKRNKKINRLICQLLSRNEYKIQEVNLHVNEPRDYHIWTLSDPFASLKTNHHSFHRDTSINCIKIMLYLSDVKECNGPFTYVIGSHRWNNCLWDKIVRRTIRLSGLYKRDDLSKRKFSSLPKFLQIKNEIFLEELNDPIYRTLILNNIQYFLSQTENLIIFDPYGIHQGGIVNKGKRIALQLIIKK